MRQKIAQAGYEFFQGEPGGSRAGREFSSHLVELAFALGRLSFQFLVADKRPRSLMGFEQPPEFQLAIGAHHGVGVNGEVDRELADSGQLIASREGAGGDAGAHLIDELTVHGHAGVQVEREFEAAVLGELRHEY